MFASPRPSIGNISAASLILHPGSTRTQDDDDAANSLMTFSFTLRFTRQPFCRNVLSHRRVVPSRRTMSKPVFWVVGRKKIQWGGKLDWLVLDGSRFFFFLRNSHPCCRTIKKVLCVRKKDNIRGNRGKYSSNVANGLYCRMDDLICILRKLNPRRQTLMIWTKGLVLPVRDVTVNRILPRATEFSVRISTACTLQLFNDLDPFACERRAPL